MRVVNVELAERSYPILIGRGLLSRLGQECRKLGLGNRCAIITDTQVGACYGATAEKRLRAADFEPVLITVPAGEPSKSWKVVEHCYDRLAAHRLERQSFVVALGGGVVGDLSGFVAATYLRGIAFVQVPTTLLAQVDSSVGGKVGINLKAGKNLVGAFHQPRLVLCDLDTLRTLPAREFRSGLGEVIKYGVICDAELFAKLEREMPKILKMAPAVLTEIVARCCEIKAEVVREDETESGLRAILNFGHTIGHAVENSVGYGRYLHGEAIAIGQVAATLLSAVLARLSLLEALRICRLLVAAGLPTRLQLNAAQRRRLRAAMKLDKKVSRGEVRFVLADRIGQVRWGQRVPDELIDEVLSLKVAE
ncbi:MAG TPA: 3-dehydroquinate synthase [Verrucomicrobiae bacterium]|nr:3-dehydroquinate synthase [Verrucomicrobiae bacterium]